jgi:ATP-dependent RNA helicase DDX6/DHH1
MIKFKILQIRTYNKNKLNHKTKFTTKMEDKSNNQVIIPEGLDVSGVVAPKKDMRIKTSDVTATKGLTFADFGLSKELQLGIYEKGYENPSPIQEESIPLALANKNIIARAKNGTGKTASYAIPMIQKVDPTIDSIQGLVLVPTRELALQTAHVIKEISKHKNIIVMVSTGGNPVKEDIFRLY